MKVLIACEESQEVCRAFRARGHEAYSCDIQDCSGGHPEWHIKDDVLLHLNDGWDLMVAHPPCTYMSAAGARWMYKGGELQYDRLREAENGKMFFELLLNCSIPMRAIENPNPLRIVALPPCTQVLQPYEFGDPFSKKTLLWLRGLPVLKSTNYTGKYEPYLQSGGKGATISKVRGKDRSKTFPGIAKAMAEQWG